MPFYLFCNHWLQQTHTLKPPGFCCSCCHGRSLLWSLFKYLDNKAVKVLLPHPVWVIFLMMCVSLPTCNVTSRRIKHHSTKQKSSQTGVINTLLSFNHQHTLKIQWNRNFSVRLTKSEEIWLQDSYFWWFSLWETYLLLRKKKGLNFSCICESYIHYAVQMVQPLCVSLTETLQSHLFYCFMAKVLYEKKTIIFLVR